MLLINLMIYRFLIGGFLAHMTSCGDLSFLLSKICLPANTELDTEYKDSINQ